VAVICTVQAKLEATAPSSGTGGLYTSRVMRCLLRVSLFRVLGLVDGFAVVLCSCC